MSREEPTEGEQPPARVVDPGAILDLNQVLREASALPGVSIPGDTTYTVRSRMGEDHWRSALLENRTMVFDEKSGLFLDVGTVIAEARKSQEVILDPKQKSIVQKALKRVKVATKTYGMIGAVVTALVSLGAAYEKGIDTYLHSARAGEVRVENRAVLHVKAPFVGAVEYGREAWTKASEFGSRMHAKDDSLRSALQDRIPQQAVIRGDHLDIVPQESTMTGASMQLRANQILDTLLVDSSKIQADDPAPLESSLSPASESRIGPAPRISR